eukprot:6197200-Pleurochrysis_carterae.AAC.1
MEAVVAADPDKGKFPLKDKATHAHASPAFASALLSSRPRILAGRVSPVSRRSRAAAAACIGACVASSAEYKYQMWALCRSRVAHTV